MANVTVVGSQWGDEGKGKIVDWLCERADAVVRFQGGHNAGHTLVIDGRTYKLSLVPSGVVRPGTLSIIGNGVVVDPWALLDEIDGLADQGLDIGPDRLMVADNAALILPVHRLVDAASERARGNTPIGTTGRGIGPAYEDKVARRAIRLCDLAEPETLRAKLDQLLHYRNALLRAFGAEEADPEALHRQLTEVAGRILPYAGVAWQRLEALRKQGARVLFEGAQGAMLDVDHGTYPFVTSSHTVGGHAAAGSGAGGGALGYVLGITKAYTTRVGAGPFPSEEEGEVGTLLGQRGNEFGTVTGRKRRCGWFDSVMVRQAVKVSGINGIALTKLDVLDGIESLRVCVGYESPDGRLDHFPAGQSAQAAVRPVYEAMDGWTESTKGARSWSQLPAAAIKYIRRIEELIEAPVALLSTSPERDDTILVQDPFLG